MKMQFFYFHLGEDFPSDSDLLEKLPEINDRQNQTNGWCGIVTARDGKHDSTGHSATFCAYTILCCIIPMIIHFDMVQVCTCTMNFYKNVLMSSDM